MKIHIDVSSIATGVTGIGGRPIDSVCWRFLLYLFFIFALRYSRIRLQAQGIIAGIILNDPTDGSIGLMIRMLLSTQSIC